MAKTDIWDRIRALQHGQELTLEVEPNRSHVMRVYTSTHINPKREHKIRVFYDKATGKMVFRCTGGSNSTAFTPEAFAAFSRVQQRLPITSHQYDILSSELRKWLAAIESSSTIIRDTIAGPAEREEEETNAFGDEQI